MDWLPWLGGGGGRIVVASRFNVYDDFFIVRLAAEDHHTIGPFHHVTH